ncbi:SagB family peptide dehydrogenase [Streptomyces sp. NPDC057743]|uniref:SagB family peptide dehydrogenase n=1 Tax=Streptomyces sp. NPDC057743 TaxID=3346236 RepID=UPI0036BCBB93
MQLRRAHNLVCYWLDGSFVIQNYLSGTQLALAPGAAEILAAFTDWTSEDDAVAAFPDYDPESCRTAVRQLHDFGFLVAEDEGDRDGRLAEHWGTWSPEAAALHFSSKHAEYTESAEINDEFRAGKRSALFKNYPAADRILLPRVPPDLDAPFVRTLYGRRTHRSFHPAAVPLQQFAQLLAMVFGPSEFLNGQDFGALMKRTSAAGGSRHELEAYLGVFAVEGIAPGLYHYNVLEHSLELLDPHFTRERATHLCCDQSAVGDAAVSVFLTGVVERMSSKYRAPRAYRVMLTNVGHLGQTFALTATALGLGPFQTLAFRDAELEDALGVDGITETALYVLAAGLPDTSQQSDYAAELDAFQRALLYPTSDRADDPEGDRDG